MPHYIALIHKDAGSCYGVSFPDWPGVFTVADTVDEAIRQAAEVLAFAALDWENDGGSHQIPRSRTIDELRADPDFKEDAADAVIAAVPFHIEAATVQAAE
jgi:antitoxin HicB